ncbi:MAG: 30S ribosomal protein S9 [Deltaproteobacteria bacterium]|nr:30S ribosomal protein S9 [Deltaproteobacteria bacterium]
MAEEKYYATGKRKSSIARVWLKSGNGQIMVNRQPLDDYFGRAILRMVIEQPLTLTETIGKFDIDINVSGGGHAGQAGAIKHGISKALMAYNQDLRPTLKKAGFITRDSRVKERKKYGRRAARARFQFSKR